MRRNSSSDLLRLLLQSTLHQWMFVVVRRPRRLCVIGRQDRLQGPPVPNCRDLRRIHIRLLLPLLLLLLLLLLLRMLVLLRRLSHDKSPSLLARPRRRSQ